MNLLCGTVHGGIHSASQSIHHKFALLDDDAYISSDVHVSVPWCTGVHLGLR